MIGGTIRYRIHGELGDFGSRRTWREEEGRGEGRKKGDGGEEGMQELRMADRQQDTTQRGPPAWRAIAAFLGRRR